MLRRARFRLLQGGGPACLEALGARLSLQQQPWSQQSDKAATGEGLAAPAPSQQGCTFGDKGPWPAAAAMLLVPTAGGGGSSSSSSGSSSSSSGSSSSSSSRKSSFASSSGAGRAWGSSRQLQASSLSQQRSFASKGSNSSSSNTGGGGGVQTASAYDSEPPQTVRNQRGKQVAVSPGLAAQLSPLAQLCGCSSTDLSIAVAKLDSKRQQGVLQHGTAVAAWLSSQGMEQAQLGRLLLRCPLLFSWPVEQRAGVLFGQLQQLGLSAAEAARCFEQQPVAATSPSFEPASAVLAQLFAAGSKSSTPAEQLVGSFLRGQPAAVTLLQYKTEVLQKRIDNLLGLGLSKAELVAALKPAWALLKLPPAHLAALAGVLQRDLGGGRKLFAKVLRRRPRALICSESTIRGRAQALVQVFGQQEALRIVGKAPGLLAVNSPVWQRALAVMELCGLTRKAALEVVRTNPDVLCSDWLRPSRLANRLAMERCLRLSAGQAYEQHAGYITKHGAKRVAGRPMFMQHHGLLHLLATQKNGANQEQQQGELPLISLGDVCKLPDAQFASLPAVAAAGGLPALQAFTAGLGANPAWQELQAAAQAEAARLQEDLRQAAAHGAEDINAAAAAAAAADN